MKRRLRISIRDICWLTVAVALGVYVYQDRVKNNRLRVMVEQLTVDKARAESVATEANNLASMYWEMAHVKDPSQATDSDGVLARLISNADCVILGEVVGEPDVVIANWRRTGVQYKVSVLDVAKGHGLPIGSHISVSVDALSSPVLPQKKGDIRVFFLRLNVFGDNKHHFFTHDNRFAIQPEAIFWGMKERTNEMRLRAVRQEEQK